MTPISLFPPSQVQRAGPSGPVRTGSSSPRAEDSRLVELLRNSFGAEGVMDSAWSESLAEQAARLWRGALELEGITLPDGPYDLAWWQAVSLALAQDRRIQSQKAQLLQQAADDASPGQIRARAAQVISLEISALLDSEGIFLPRQKRQELLTPSTLAERLAEPSEQRALASQLRDFLGQSQKFPVLTLMLEGELGLAALQEGYTQWVNGSTAALDCSPTISHAEAQAALELFFQHQAQIRGPSNGAGRVDLSDGAESSGATPHLTVVAPSGEGSFPAVDFGAQSPLTDKERLRALASHSAVQEALSFFLPQESGATPSRTLESLSRVLGAIGEPVSEKDEPGVWIAAINSLWQRWAKIEALGQAVCERFGQLHAALLPGLCPQDPNVVPSIARSVQEFRAASGLARLDSRWTLELPQTLGQLDRLELEITAQSPRGEWLRSELAKAGFFVPKRAGSPDVGLLLSGSAELLQRKGVPASLLPHTLARRIDLLWSLENRVIDHALTLDPTLSGQLEQILQLHNPALSWRADHGPLVLALVDQRLAPWGAVVSPPPAFEARARLVLELEGKSGDVAFWERWLQQPSAVALFASHGIACKGAMAQRLALGEIRIEEMLERAAASVGSSAAGPSTGVRQQAEMASILLEAQWLLEQQFIEYPSLERMLRTLIDWPKQPDESLSARELVQQLAICLARAGVSSAESGDQFVQQLHDWMSARMQAQPFPKVAPTDPDSLVWSVWSAWQSQDRTALDESRRQIVRSVQGVLTSSQLPADPLEAAVVACEIARQRNEIPESLMGHMGLSMAQLIRRRLGAELQRLRPEQVGDDWDIVALALEIFCVNQSRAIDALVGSSSVASARSMSVHQVLAWVHLAQPRLSKLEKFLINDLGLTRLPLLLSFCPKHIGERILSTIGRRNGSIHVGIRPSEPSLRAELTELGVAPTDCPTSAAQMDALAADINLVRSLEGVWWPHLPPREDQTDPDYAALVRAWLSCQPEDLQRTTALHISSLGLTRLPPEFCACTDLRELDLSGNRCTLQGLDSLTGLKRLRSLNLSRNDLKEVRSSWFRSPDLLHLDLSHNQLSKSLNDATWGNLCSCRYLDLSHNRLTTWPCPRGLTRPLTIRTLLMHANPLTEDTGPWTFTTIRHLSVDPGVAIPHNAWETALDKGMLQVWRHEAGLEPDQFLFEMVGAGGSTVTWETTPRSLPPWELLNAPYLKINRRLSHARTGGSPFSGRSSPLSPSRRERLNRMDGDRLRADPQARLMLLGDLLHRDAQDLCSPGRYAALWALLDRDPPLPSQEAWPSAWEAGDMAIAALHEKTKGQTRWVRWWLLGTASSRGSQLELLPLELLPQPLQDRLILSKAEAEGLLDQLNSCGELLSGKTRRPLVQALIRAAHRDGNVQTSIEGRWPKKSEERCRAALPFWYFGLSMTESDRASLLQLIGVPSVQWSEPEKSRILSLLKRWSPMERLAAARPSTFADLVHQSIFSDDQRALLLEAGDGTADQASQPTLRAIFCSTDFLETLSHLEPDDRRSVEQWMVEAAQGARLKPRPVPYHLSNGRIADHDHLNSMAEGTPLVISYLRARGDQALQFVHLASHATEDRSSRSWPVHRETQLGYEFQVLDVGSLHYVEWEPSFELRKACALPRLVGKRPLGRSSRAIYLSSLAVEQMSWLHSRAQQGLINRLRQAADNDLFRGGLSSALSPFGEAFPALSADPLPSWGRMEPVLMLCADTDRKSPLLVAAVTASGWSPRLEDLAQQVHNITSHGWVWHEPSSQAYCLQKNIWRSIDERQPAAASQARVVARMPESDAAAPETDCPVSSMPDRPAGSSLQIQLAQQVQNTAVAASAIEPRKNFWDELDQFLGDTASQFPLHKKQRLNKALTIANPLACLLGHRPAQMRDAATMPWLLDLPRTAWERLDREQRFIEAALRTHASSLTSDQVQALREGLDQQQAEKQRLRALSGIEQIAELEQVVWSCWEMKKFLAGALLQALPDQAAISQIISWAAPDLHLPTLDFSAIESRVHRAVEQLLDADPAAERRGPGRNASLTAQVQWIMAVRDRMIREIGADLDALKQQFAEQGTQWTNPVAQQYQRLLARASSAQEVEWSSQGDLGNAFLGAYRRDLSKLRQQIAESPLEPERPPQPKVPRPERAAPCSVRVPAEGEEATGSSPAPSISDGAVRMALQALDPAFDPQRDDQSEADKSSIAARRVAEANQTLGGLLGRAFSKEPGLPERPRQRGLLAWAGWIMRTSAVIQQRIAERLALLHREIAQAQEIVSGCPQLEKKVRLLPAAVPVMSQIPLVEELRSLGLAFRRIEECRAALDDARS